MCNASTWRTRDRGKDRERKGQITTSPGVMRDSFSASLLLYKMFLLPRKGSEKCVKGAAADSTGLETQQDKSNHEAGQSARGTAAATVLSPRAQTEKQWLV